MKPLWSLTGRQRPIGQPIRTDHRATRLRAPPGAREPHSGAATEGAANGLPCAGRAARAAAGRVCRWLLFAASVPATAASVPSWEARRCAMNGRFSAVAFISRVRASSGFSRASVNSASVCAIPARVTASRAPFAIAYPPLPSIAPWTPPSSSRQDRPCRGPDSRSAATACQITGPVLVRPVPSVAASRRARNRPRGSASPTSGQR
jgi:hypothetical protein